MKITINNPCYENWDSMSPNDKGAFCLACQKNVIDFSSKNLAQIKEFFTRKTSSESVCARFDEQQLNALSFDDFFNEYLNWKFFQKAALIVFFVFGANLFAEAQTVRGSHLIKGETEAHAIADTNKVIPKKVNRDESLIMGKAKCEPVLPEKKEPGRIMMGEPEIQHRKTN